jgi:hypothetical protein
VNQDKHDADDDGRDGDHAQDPPEVSALWQKPPPRADMVSRWAGAPEEMGYCHCNSCRTYSGAPLTAFTLWRQATVNAAVTSWSITRASA